MGYLTTITIRNDALDAIEEHKDIFMDGLLKHCCHISPSSQEGFRVGYFANPVVLQRTRHADDPTIYVHMGNTVVEMNSHSYDTKEMLEQNPDFFNKVIKFMEQETKRLKTLMKKNRLEDKL